MQIPTLPSNNFAAFTAMLGFAILFFCLQSIVVFSADISASIRVMDETLRTKKVELDDAVSQVRRSFADTQSKSSQSSQSTWFVRQAAASTLQQTSQSLANYLNIGDDMKRFRMASAQLDENLPPLIFGLALGGMLFAFGMLMWAHMHWIAIRTAEVDLAQKVAKLRPRFRVTPHSRATFR